jgi:hypothetical protein
MFGCIAEATASVTEAPVGAPEGAIGMREESLKSAPAMPAFPGSMLTHRRPPALAPDL